MNAFPSEQDIKTALKLFIDEYQVPDSIIKDMFGQQNYMNLNSILTSLQKKTINTTELIRMMIIEKGAYLFSGHDEAVRSLRAHLLRQIPTQQLIDLYNRNPSQGRSISSPSYMIRPLAEKNG